MEKLAIKELAAYLPYGLKLNTIENEMYSIDVKNKKIESIFRGHLINIYEWDEIKPILRPLSDLDKNIGGIDICSIYDLKEFKSEDNKFIPYILSEYLFENHFDVFGLIEKGLAIDASTLTNKP